MPITDTDLATLLRTYRERLNLTMEEFGRRYGVSKQAVSLWESGESRPRPEVLKQMGVYYVLDVK